MDFALIKSLSDVNSVTLENSRQDIKNKTLQNIFVDFTLHHKILARDQQQI